MGSRIKALDGWRGIAILMVIADHFDFILSGHNRAPLFGEGQHGVTIFFVLSGYLITSKLLEHKAGLREFYLRRFFRLMPVAWAYLLFVCLFVPLLHTTVKYEIPSLLFYRNFIPDGTGFTGHFWSLSMEEQFYFVWPPILALCGRKRALWLTITAAVSCAAYRFLMWSHFDHVGVDTVTQVRADALLVGCALALIMANTTGLKVIKRIPSYAVTVTLIVLICCLWRFRWLPPLTESVAIAVLIAASITKPRSILGRVLSFGPLAWLGVISYSVYVWQQLFASIPAPLGLFIGVPLFSICSYYFIERPMQKVGRRLTRRHKLEAALV